MLYYQFLTAFKKGFNKDLLFSDHITSGQIKIDKMSTPDGGESDTYNFWGYRLEKDGTKYLLSCIDRDGKEIDLKHFLPIRAKKTLKLASRGEVFYHITQPVKMKFNPTRTMSFKELVDTLSSLEHSNEDHYKLLWLIAMTQLINRANFRVSTPPGFGKDSTIDILGGLVGHCSTIENPTIAKLEERSTFLKLMAINEVVDLSPAEWRTIQQFLLATGAFKPEVTKHSRAYKNTGETLDISELSLLMFYNDIDCYSTPKDYLDFISKTQLLDRFVPVRVHGSMTEKFNESNSIDPDNFASQNRDNYIELIKNIEYYKLNIRNYSKGFKSERAKMWMENKKVPSRWKTNLGRLLTTIEVYSESQKEFDKWVDVLFDCIYDYQQMLEYPSLLQNLYAKMNINKKVLSEFETILDAIRYLKSKNDHRHKFLTEIQKMATFVEKNKLIREYKDKNNPDRKIQSMGATGDSFWN